MFNSILHFIKNDIIEIEKITAAMLRGELEAHALSENIQGRMMKLGCELLSELYEKLDEEIRESLIRKKQWTI